MSNIVLNGEDMSKLSPEQLLAEIAKLTASVQAEREAREKAEAKAKKATNKATPFMAVSDKGALSLYRINTRFPVTLYKNQWQKVLDMADEIREFIKENNDKLKDPPVPAHDPKGSVDVTPK